MNEISKKEFLKHLDLELKNTRKIIGQLQEFTKPIAPNVNIGRLTRMEALNDKAIKENNLRTETIKLIKLEETFRKSEDDDFGMCISCKNEIPYQRLLVIPHTKVCVNCLSKLKK